MFSKFLPLLIVTGVLFLKLGLITYNPAPAGAQAKADEFVLIPFPVNTNSPETIFQNPSLEMQPLSQANVSAVNPAAAAQDVSPAVSSTMRISQVYTRGGEAGANFLNDYIEIFNAGNTTININGWAVVVNTFEGSTQQAFAAQYTSNNQITPGMHLLIRSKGNGSNGQPLTGLLSTIDDISLGSTSGQIFLLSPAQAQTFNASCPTSTGPNGTATDFVGYGPTNCSEGSPAPALTQSNKALTRINGGCTDTDNNLSDFSITDPNPRNIFSTPTQCGSASPTPTPTPTPSPTPSASPTPTASPTSTAASNMRISQVYTRGGETGASFQNDYVEIFNAGTTTIDIKGWAVVVNTFEGSTQQAFAAQYTSNNQITPGMHLLIRYKGNGSNGQPLTGLLSTIDDISLGSTSGQIFLLSPTQAQNFTPGCPTSIGPNGTVSDVVGYGPTNCFEGSPAPALPQSNK